MREIADKSNAYLLSDMAHISGLVAAGELQPWPWPLHCAARPCCPCFYSPKPMYLQMLICAVGSYAWCLALHCICRRTRVQSQACPLLRFWLSCRAAPVFQLLSVVWQNRIHSCMLCRRGAVAL